MIEEIKSLKELKKIKNLDRYVLWFTNPNCVPCKRLKPVILSISIKFGKEVKFFKIDINKNPEIAEKYNVTTVPTIIFLKRGKEVSRLLGYIRKDDVVNSLKNLLGESFG